MKQADLIELNRKAVLDALAQGPMETADLVKETGLSTKTVQVHLRALRLAGLVSKDPNPGLGRGRRLWAAVTKPSKRA